VGFMPSLFAAAAGPGSGSRRKEGCIGRCRWWCAGGGRQHTSSRQATAKGEKGIEQAGRQSFLQQTKHERQADPALVSPTRCWCFWLPANDCDCLGALPSSLQWPMDSWDEHSWRLQQKATLQLEFFFSASLSLPLFLLDFLDSDENSRTS
jgi:hypothetical protein